MQILLKKFTCLICIFSLTLPVVYAEDSSSSSSLSDAVNSTTSDSDKDDDEKEDTEGTVDGTVVQHDIDYEGDKAKIGKTQQAFSWLMILASLAMLPTMLALCSTKVEMGIIMAASLALIIAEVALHATFKTSSDQDFKIYEGKDFTKQKEALQTASDITDHNIKAAYARMAVHFAWGVAMTAAGVLAIVSHAKDMALTAASCAIAAAACAATCAPTAGACPRSTTCTTSDNTFNTPLSPEMNPFQDLKLYSKKLDNSPDDLHSYLLIEESKRLHEGALKSESITVIEDLMRHNPAPDNKLSAFMKEINHALEQVQGLIIPNAMAMDMSDFKKDNMWEELGPLIGLTGGAIVGMLALSAAIAKKAVPLASLNGIARGILWNSLASFGYISGSLSAVTAVNLKKDKDKYDELIDKLSKMDEAEENYASADNYKAINQPLNLNFNPGDPKLAALQDQLCTQDGKRAQTYFSRSGTCKCVGNKCGGKKLDIDYGGGFVPPMIQGVQGSNSKTFNSAINGDMEGASVGFNEMGSYATNVKNTFKKMKDLSNKQLKDLGAKPMDHDKMESALLGSLGETGRNAINNLPPKQRASLLSYAASSAPSNEGDESDATKTIRNNPDLAKVEKVIQQQVSADNEKKGVNFFDFLANEDKKKENTDSMEGKLAKSTKDLKNYKIDTQEINKGSTKNIFKIIQYRYFKSAYPILLKKKK